MDRDFSEERKQLMGTIINFNAGPAMLPPEVLQRVQAESAATTRGAACRSWR